jgi:hypothetical protein
LKVEVNVKEIREEVKALYCVGKRVDRLEVSITQARAFGWIVTPKCN